MKKTQRIQLAGVMRNAWQLSRQGVQRFGGTTKLYFCCALRLAWADTRTRSVYRKGQGNRFWMPGVAMPASEVKRGQFTLPGIL